jgi:replicative DNA helicase Mcm
MAQAPQDPSDVTDRFIQFYRKYYRNEIGTLAQKYPNEQRSLYVDYDDLSTFDMELAEDYLAKPDQMQEYAEEALRLYDLPADVKLGRAHVRLTGLPETVDIRNIRVHDDHIGRMIAVQGIVRKATDVRPKITEAAFECQRCGTMTYIPQSDSGFQEPHECQGCERQGPFHVDFDQSEFVDAQKVRVQESPEGLRGGETPQNIDVDLEDDVTGQVTAGDHVTVTGVLHIEQQTSNNEKTPIFDLYMDGVAVEIEDEEFEDMNITEEDVAEIVDLSNEDDIHELMIDSVAPSIYGYREEKLAMILQLFSGVTKHLPDGSRIRGDLHMLLIGDPGTGKCVAGDTRVTLADGSEVPICKLVEENLDDPKPVDDGVWDTVDIDVPSMEPDGSLTTQRATKVWKREAPNELYRIRTASGKEIEVTPSHPLFVVDDGRPDAVVADNLGVGQSVAVPPASATRNSQSEFGAPIDSEVAADGGVTTDRIESIEPFTPDDEWVYDLEVAETHSYLTNGIISHNSAMLQYIRNIAPRSVYTSGKGSSSAGLTAAAVRDDFGDGQQWTLEAGALVLADKGIAAVDELDKMRCVTGDTLVHTANGIRPIRDLAHQASENGTVESLPNGRTIRGNVGDVWTLADDGTLVQRSVTAVHEYEAPGELLQVTLESGESIQTTADHPFFVFENGERVTHAAENLGSGDWVYIPKAVQERATDGGVTTEPSPQADASSRGPSPKSGIPPSKGAILGYLAGDGNVYSNDSEGSYGIRFTNSEEQLLRHFESVCEAAYDADTVRHPSEQRTDGVETVRLHGKRYVDDLLEAGLNLETYDGKRLPTAVTRSNRETKAAFVRALADSEATVGERAVKIYSSSYELLLGTSMLLSEFGIQSQIQTRSRSEKRDLYALAITSDESLAAYEQHIGFTLNRKQTALKEAVQQTTGDRAILDVLPDFDEQLGRLRGQLRLYQSECGLDDATYCNFENGDANPSFHSAEHIYNAFEDRRRQASKDLELLAASSEWSELGFLCEEYHISQQELARGSTYSQQQISQRWGDDPALRTTIVDRLRTIMTGIAGTSLTRFHELIDGDVRWRKIDSVEPVSPGHTDTRIPILERELGDVLEHPPEGAYDRADELLKEDPSAETWDELRDELDRHGVSFQQLADELDVAGSTVSRWFSGAVDVDNFDSVREVAFDLVESVRTSVTDLRSEIRGRKQGTKVYDLTVQGTHNFVANGMIVHNSEDRSAMHEALEQQSISVSKAGINATLKSRCSLLGAANPKYGRFDQYEPIGEQIDLEPALISRFDLIFTVTDSPDPETDAQLAEHIINTNYAGELHTQRTHVPNSEFTDEEVDAATAEVTPEIEAELLRKYIAYAKRNCYPTMTEEAKEVIRQFYVDFRAKGADEDAPVPVTARKLEALVRLSEASARLRLSDTVEREDAVRVTEIVESCLRDIGMDPETGEFDADIVETGTSKTQRDRIKDLKHLIEELEDEYDEGAPVSEVVSRAGEELGLEESKAEQEIENLRRKGEVYEPRTDYLRTT